MNDTDRKTFLLVAADVLRAHGRVDSFEAIRRYAHDLNVDSLSTVSEIIKERPVGVSIIMPTFKGASRISRALDSLLAQTENKANFEVIIVSNGALDNTPSVVADYQRLHDDLRVVFLRTEAASASYARNYGLSHARFAYCTYLDDDDYISPHYISVLLKHADPNRLVFAKIIDFDDAGQRPSPISEQLQTAVQTVGGNLIARPFQVRGILSMTCAKLAPTSCLLGIDFDIDLRSGEDVVFWANVIVKHRLDLYVPENIDEAVYYREVRQGSVSRRTDEFSFSVTERLEVIFRVQEIERLQALVMDVDHEDFVQSRYAGQIGFITKFLNENRERYSDFLNECLRLSIRDDIVRMVNDSLADTLVISYCFPPFNDTSAIVMMKRILGWQWPVRVISNDMDNKRSRSPELSNAVRSRLASHVELMTPVSFAGERSIREFAEQSLKNFQAMPKQQSLSKIYSRAMWPASAFAAALIKINNPRLKWIAEFSDPLVLDIHGQERKGEIPMAWLTSSGLREAIGELAPDHVETTQLFRLAELLPYILADEIVFTNESQREYMLSQPWLQAVRERAILVSTISSHPTLSGDYYSIGTPSIDVDRKKLNIGFFGSFYATRGLREVLVAMKRASHLHKKGLIFHVVSSDANTFMEEVNALGISDLVKIHASLPYFDCLASFHSMDYLLVNDAMTAGIKPLNPYLPSKLSDYLGAKKPIWALAEPGSSLSKVELPDGSIMSTLGDEIGYFEALTEMLRTKSISID